MSTKSTDSALQVSVVVNPIVAIIVQESSKRSCGVWLSIAYARTLDPSLGILGTYLYGFGGIRMYTIACICI